MRNRLKVLGLLSAACVLTVAVAAEALCCPGCGCGACGPRGNPFPSSPGGVPTYPLPTTPYERVNQSSHPHWTPRAPYHHGFHQVPRHNPGPPAHFQVQPRYYR